MRDRFDSAARDTTLWRASVLATPLSSFDETMAVKQTAGNLVVTPHGHADGQHFSGYVSNDTFDLSTCRFVAAVQRAAAGAVTIFAAAIDAENWAGFRIESGKLWLESHAKGKVSAKSIAYHAASHRFLRLRVSRVAPTIVWETSSDGQNWTPEYVETHRFAVRALHVVLSAGTVKPVAAPGSAAFNVVAVEQTP
jgi:hypothetical protein